MVQIVNPLTIVNVGGGGGIQDQQFNLESLGGLTQVGTTATSIAKPTGAERYVDLKFTYFGYKPIDNVSISAQADYREFEANGYVEKHCTIGNSTVTLRIPGPLANYTSGPNLSDTNPETTVTYVYGELDWDNKVLAGTARYQVYNNGTNYNCDGDMYFVPVVVKDPELAGTSGLHVYRQNTALPNARSDEKLPNSFCDVSKIDTTNSMAQLYYNIYTENQAIGVYAGEISGIDENVSSQYDYLKTGYWAAFWVCTSGIFHNTSINDVKNYLENTSVFPNGCQIFGQVYSDPNSWAYYKDYPVFDPAELAQVYAANFDPLPTTALSLAKDSSDLSLQVQSVGNTTKYLHEFLSNMRLGTIRTTDQTTWETTDHVAVYGTDDNLDMSGSGFDRLQPN